MGVRKITVKAQEDTYDLDTRGSVNSTDVLQKTNQEEQKAHPPIPSWRRYAGLATSLVESLLFGGTIYGWYSLVYIFKQDGIYADLCDPPGGNSSTTPTVTTVKDTTSVADSSQVGCDAQAEQLQLAFTIALVVQGVSSLLLGIFFDKFGLLPTRIIGSLIAVTAYLLLAFTDISRPWMIFPGSSCLAVSCISIILTNSHVSSLAGSLTPLMIALNNGAVNTSGAVFFVIKLVHEAGIPRVYSLSFLCCLWSIVLLSTVFILPHGKVPSFTEPPPNRIIDVSSDSDSVFVINGHGQGSSNPAVIDGLSSNGNTVTTGILGHDQMTIDYLQDDIINSNRNQLSDNKSVVSQPKHLHTQVGDSESVAEEREKPLWKYIFSSLNIIYLFWFATLHVCIMFYLGSFNTRITDILNGDTNQVSYFTNMLAYAQMCAIFIAPLSGALVVWRKRSMMREGLTGQSRSIATILSILLTCAAALVLVVTSLIENQNLLYVSIFASEVFRSSLYPTGIAFLEITWPGSAFGALFGMSYVIAGAAALMQFPYTIWIQRSGFFAVDLFFLGTCLSTLVLPITIAVRYYTTRSKTRKEAGIKA